MSWGDGGEAGFYATTKVAWRASPALNSSAVLGITLNCECQGLCGHHESLSLPLPGAFSTVGNARLSPCPQVWVAEEATLVSAMGTSPVQ